MMAAETEVPIDDEAFPLVASSLHSALPQSCQIPFGLSVGYKKNNGTLECFGDAETFFKAHARDWTDLVSYQFSKEGTVMSKFIQGIVDEGIASKTIQDRCVQVKIKNMLHFGVLNSAFNPCGDYVVPKHMIDSIAFVILVNQALINRKMDYFIESFVNYLRRPVV